MQLPTNPSASPSPATSSKGQWPRERLAQMDEEFRARLQCAIEHGDERQGEGVRRER
jgi:hypothetical protein